MRDTPYWHRVRRVTALLLVAWFLASFVVTFFARDLSFEVWGWPFGFWMAAQGSLWVFIIITAVYAWVVNRLDAHYGIQDPPPLDPADEA